MLKHGILGLLNYGQMTGYEIMTAFLASLSHFWVAQTSQIYRELQGLEKNGWIRITHVAQESRPDKNILSITEKGREELLRWLREDEWKENIRNPMLMKTFFRGECSIDENLEFFKAYAERIAIFPEGSHAADEAKNEYEEMLDVPEKAIYWQFTIEYGVMYEKMLKEWSEYCISKLEALKHENTVD